jgi:3-oxoacyl-(acyl-carrier-protein) synthase
MDIAAANGVTSDITLALQRDAPPRAGSSVLPLDIGIVRGGDMSVFLHDRSPARSRSTSMAALTDANHNDILSSIRSMNKDMLTPPIAPIAAASSLGLSVNIASAPLSPLSPSPMSPSLSVAALPAAGAMAVSTTSNGIVEVESNTNIKGGKGATSSLSLTRQARSGSNWDANSVDIALQRTTDIVALSIHSVLSNIGGGARRPRILVFSSDAQYRAGHLAELHDYESRPLTSLHDTREERDGLYWCNDISLLALCHPNSFDVIMCFNLGAGPMASTRGRRHINFVIKKMERLLRPGGCFTGTGVFRGATKIENDTHIGTGEEYPRVSLPLFRDIVEDHGFYVHAAMDMSLEGNVVLRVASDAAEPCHPLDLVRSGQLLCGRFLATKHSSSGQYSQHRQILSVTGQSSSSMTGGRRAEFKEAKQLSRLQIARSNKAKDDAKAALLAAAAAAAASPSSSASPMSSNDEKVAAQAVGGNDRKQVTVAEVAQHQQQQIVAPLPLAAESKQQVTNVAVCNNNKSTPCDNKENKRNVKVKHNIKEQGIGGMNERYDTAVEGGCGVVITGTALGLPNDLYAGRSIFDASNVASIFAGDNFISNYTSDEKKAMLGMNIVQVTKSKEGKRMEHTLTRDAECIQVGSKIGQFDLAREYGVPPIIVETLDTTYQLAIAAGIEALRDAGILQQPNNQVKEKTNGGSCKPMALPSSMQDETGVIFACSFPCMDSTVEEVTRNVAARTRRELLDELKGGIARALHINLSIAPPSDPNDAHAAATYQYNRKLLFKILVMANSQLAELISAKGPNTQINSACAGTTQAIAMGEDWIRSGRCRRVIVVSADNPTSPASLPYLGTGFLALGAASTAPTVAEAAIPFDKRRKGMILGAGAVALVLESVNTALARNGSIKAELLGSVMKNSAFHASLMSGDHIGSEMSRFIDKMSAIHGVDTDALANDLIYFSHETCTSANGGCAQVEMDALASSFGRAARNNVLIANTKGFTGHAMAVSIEDVMAVESLLQDKVPPIANHRVVDPALGDLLLSRGGSHSRRYVLRLAAGFGSQFVMLLLRKWDADRVSFWQQRIQRQQQLQQHNDNDRGVKVSTISASPSSMNLNMLPMLPLSSPLPSPSSSRVSLGLFIDPSATPTGSSATFLGNDIGNSSASSSSGFGGSGVGIHRRSRSLDNLASPFYIRMPLVSPLPSPSPSPLPAPLTS